MVALKEMVERYYQARHSFKGALPFVRKGTLDELDAKKAIAFFHSEAPRFMAQAHDE